MKEQHVCWKIVLWTHVQKIESQYWQDVDSQYGIAPIVETEMRKQKARLEIQVVWKDSLDACLGTRTPPNPSRTLLEQLARFAKLCDNVSLATELLKHRIESRVARSRKIEYIIVRDVEGAIQAWQSQQKKEDSAIRRKENHASGKADFVASRRRMPVSEEAELPLDLLVHAYLAALLLRNDQAGGNLRALAGYEKALGAEHMSTLTTVNNLGSLYQKQSKLEKAEQMYIQALAGREKALGAEHTLTLHTVNNFGSLNYVQGDLAKAEQIFLRTLVEYEKALGAEHTSTLTTINYLGILYRAQGKLVEAEQMYLRELAGKEKALGIEHTSTLNTADNLSNLYYVQGKLADCG
jgi:tetratricopeptide (TPR) repeat protein